MALTERLGIVIDAFGIGAVNEFKKVGNTAKSELSKVDKATKGTRQETGLLNDALNKMGLTSVSSSAALKMLAGVGLAAAGAAAVKFGKDAVSAFVNATGEVRAFQRVSGGTAEESSKLVGAMHLLGIDSDAVSKGFGILSKNIERGTKTFTDLHIAVAQNKDGNTDLIGTLFNISDAYGRASSQAEKNNIALSAFGRGGLALLPILARGREGIQELFAATGRSGLIFDQAALERGRQFALAGRELQESFKGLEVNIGEKLVPALTSAAQIASTLVDDITAVVNKASSFHLPGDKNSFAKDVGDGLKTIFSGIPGGAIALGLLSQKHKEATASAVDLIAAEKELNSTLASAPNALSAEINAQHGLRNAQESVDHASQGVANAQRTLNDLLRKGAVDAKAVADAQYNLKQANLAVEDATKGVAQAQKNLNQVRAEAPEDRAKAGLGVDEAKLGITDADLAVKQARASLRQARGSGDRLAVAQAQEALQHALLGQQSAAFALTDAQKALNDAQDDGSGVSAKEHQAQDQLTQSERNLENAQHSRLTAIRDLHTAEVGDVDFAAKVQAAREGVTSAEHNLRDAREGVVTQTLALYDAQQKVNDVIGAGSIAAGLLESQLQALVQLYPALQPILDQLHADIDLSLAHSQQRFAGAGPGMGLHGVVGDTVSVLQPGPNLVFNKTGKPERYMNADLATGGGTNATFVFPNYVGNRDELQRFLQDALLKLQSRGGNLGIRAS